MTQTTKVTEDRLAQIISGLNDPRCGCYEVRTHTEAVEAAKALAERGIKVRVSSRGPGLPKSLIVME